MKVEDVNKLKVNTPVKLADGKLGILIGWPGDNGLCAIQVPREEDIRWVHHNFLEDRNWEGVTEVIFVKREK